MPDLEDGATIEMKGSGSKPYIIKNVGGVYSCTCPAWRNQSLQPYQRTCKHIRKLRGDMAEEARLGSALAMPTRKAEGDLKEGPPVLLAESWDTESNVEGWWMSEKLDGARAYWDGKQFVSRLGNTFLAPDFFMEAMPNVPLDGELWMARKAFTRTMSVIRRHDKPADWKEVRFVVFDAPAHGGEFEARLRFLDDLLTRHPTEYVQRLAQQPCKGNDHLFSELDRVSELGGEGLMLRQPGSLYESGRSSTLLKVKRFHDAEARVIGYVAGAGKHKGRTGSLEVELPTGARCAIGTGLSDAERVNPPAIGTIISFRYQELSENGIPRFPSYIGVRNDGVESAVPATPAMGSKSSIKVSVPASPPAADGRRRFEFVDGSSSKFWEVWVEGCRMTTCYGRIGSKGTMTIKESADEAAARKAMDKAIVEKQGKGYVEKGGEANTGR